MSVKHVKNYYRQLCDQYDEMIDNIKSLEKEVEQGLVEPERIDRLRAQVAPLKQNYERWSYMLFLLNQPNRKSKRARYQCQNQKKLSALDKNNSLDAVIAENAETLKHIGE